MLLLIGPVENVNVGVLVLLVDGAASLVALVPNTNAVGAGAADGALDD